MAQNLFEFPDIESQERAIKQNANGDIAVLSNGSLASSREQAEASLGADPNIGANQTRQQQLNF